MKKIVSSFLVLILFVAPLSQIFAQSLDDLSKTVVFLQKEFQATEMKSGEKVEVWYKYPSSSKYEPKIIKQMGTGFIINHNGKDYLVTAKHVAQFLDNNSEILLNVTKDSSVSIPFGLIRKSSFIKNARWFIHPKVDLALHPIIYPSGKIEQLHIGTSDIIKEDKKIDLLTDVIIFGFPLGLGVHKSINPIAKKSQIASNVTTIDLPEVDPNLKFYLLDQALAQGYSGSPIFISEEIPSGVSVGNRPLSAGEKITLIGILSGGLSDATGGKISVVVPISYLWEILNSDEFIQYEKQY